MSASFTGGTAFFTVLMFFISVITYSSVLASQYYGCGDHKKVGLTIWQAIIGSCIASIVIGSGYWWVEPLFNYIGYDSPVRIAQIRYVTILCATSFFPLLMTALTAFWCSRGKTWVVLLIEGSTVILNCILNYLLIFGTTVPSISNSTDAVTHPFLGGLSSIWSFIGINHISGMGITGAAVGTAVSTAVGTVIAFMLFLNKANCNQFGTRARKLFDPVIFKQLLKYGAPNGMRAVLGVGAFTVFVFALTRSNDVVRNTAAITFAINSLAFIPLFGIGRSVSILVGQSLGAKRIDIAHRSVKNGMVILVGYLLLVVTLLVLFEEIPLSLFNINGSGTFLCAERFLTFLSCTLIMNGISILYSSAVSAAGDTKFSMKVTMSLSWGMSAIPVLIIYLFGGSVFFLWFAFMLHTIPKAAVFYWRYRSGKWLHLQPISG